MVSIIIILAVLLIVKEIIWTIKELELIDRCFPATSCSSSSPRANKILKKILNKIKSKSKASKTTSCSASDENNENKEVF